MKKLFIISILAIASFTANAQNNLSIGVYTSHSVNPSRFSEGSSDANALFNHGKYSTMTLGIVGRYFIGKHWSVQSGINKSHIGFTYGIAKDYSLVKAGSHYTKNKISVPVMQIPLIGIYSFKPNCSNFRLFVGGGVNIMAHLRDMDKTKDVTISAPEQTATPDYINQTVSANRFVTATGQLTCGVEKIMKRGGILQAAFVVNKGFRTIATSTVTYSIDNKVYSHTFSNKGNYVGMSLNYYFRPLKMLNAQRLTNLKK